MPANDDVAASDEAAASEDAAASENAANEDAAASEDAAKVELSSVIARNDAIVFTDLDDTIVMMDVDEGHYYELDPIAARIWALLEEASSASSICETLAGEYEVDAETCQRDTLEFLQAGLEQRIFELQAAS